MEAILLGWLLLALTTALTALIRIYHPTLLTIKHKFPDSKINKSTQNGVLGGFACFLFSLVVFPLMMGIMFIEPYRQAFISELALAIGED